MYKNKILICSECGILFDESIALRRDYRHDDGELHCTCPHCLTEFTEEEWNELQAIKHAEVSNG